LIHARIFNADNQQKMKHLWRQTLKIALYLCTYFTNCWITNGGSGGGDDDDNDDDNNNNASTVFIRESQLFPFFILRPSSQKYLTNLKLSGQKPEQTAK
jgi:hypothetical protein